MHLSLVTILIIVGTASNCFGAVNLVSIDTKVYDAFTTEFQTLAGKGIPKDKSGLLGRNHKWGKLYSPRFQLGAGKGLRISLVAGDIGRAKKAYLGIKKGTEAIEDNGYVRTTIPEKIARGRLLSDGDIASAAGWLEKRIDNSGRVNSSGNKRTCEGGESFLGNPKKIALDDVFMSLAFLGIMKHDQKLLNAARRVSKWYTNNTGSDPCFHFNS